MTWLPVDVGPEASDVLELVPESGSEFQRLLDAAWSMTDDRLIELCWLRIAQMLPCPAALALTDDEQLLAELESWESSTRFSEAERAALGFTEYFLFDCNAVTREHKEALERLLGLGGLFNFASALSTVENYLRACVLLELEPERPTRSERPERAGEPEVGFNTFAGLSGEGIELRALRAKLTDPEFMAARASFGRATVRSSAAAPLTTEVCRLRNASYQQCHY